MQFQLRPSLPDNPLEFWHQFGSTTGPIPVSRTSSLLPLLRMLRFPTTGQGERRRCVRRSMSRNSEGTLQLKAKKTLSWKDYRSLPTLKFWEVMGVLVHKYYRVTIGIVSVIAFSVSKDSRIRYLWASDFGLSDLNLPDKWSFLGVLKLQKNCNQSRSSKLFSGLVQMTLWLVHASYSLLDRQAVKLTFFARVLRPSSRRGRAAFFHSLPLPVACGSRFLLASSAAVLCALGEEDANRTSFLWKSSLRQCPSACWDFRR